MAVFLASRRIFASLKGWSLLPYGAEVENVDNCVGLISTHLVLEALALPVLDAAYVHFKSKSPNVAK